jgi:hypothetical protein
MACSSWMNSSLSCVRMSMMRCAIERGSTPQLRTLSNRLSRPCARHGSGPARAAERSVQAQWG